MTCTTDSISTRAILKLEIVARIHQPVGNMREQSGPLTNNIIHFCEKREAKSLGFESGPVTRTRH